jgi:hypothetical protein
MSLKKEPELIKRPNSTEDKDIRDKIMKERTVIVSLLSANHSS